MNINDIRKLEGICYDPSRYLPEDWEGTALDILKVEACPVEDRLWVVFYDGWIEDKTLRQFAAWCKPDVDWDIWDSVGATTWNAACRSAWEAAWDAAQDAAQDAALDAAYMAERKKQVAHLIEILDDEDEPA